VALSTLKKRAEFLRVRGGPRRSTPAFVLEARSRPTRAATATGARFGFTVSKKVGGAVVRNRVRRRLRALVAALDPGRLRQDFDYVLIARPGAELRSYHDLETDLDQAIDRVHRPRGRERRSP
jgi:ribonuclease P protein component